MKETTRSRRHRAAEVDSPKTRIRTLAADLPFTFWAVIAVAAAGFLAFSGWDISTREGRFPESVRRLVRGTALREGVTAGTGGAPLLGWVRTEQRRLLDKLDTFVTAAATAEILMLLAAVLTGIMMISGEHPVFGLFLVIGVFFTGVASSSAVDVLFDNVEVHPVREKPPRAERTHGRRPASRALLASVRDIQLPSRHPRNRAVPTHRRAPASGERLLQLFPCRISPSTTSWSSTVSSRSVLTGR